MAGTTREIWYKSNHFPLGQDYLNFVDCCSPSQVGDSVCLLLLTPLATVSAYLCGSGANYYIKQGQVAEAVSDLIVPRYAPPQAGLVCLCTVLGLVYLLWLLLTARYHCQVRLNISSKKTQILLIITPSGLVQMEE